MTSHTVIVGAGIVGAATAIWLTRAGHKVTLIDKGEPGMGASYGNGSIMPLCAMTPVTEQSLIPPVPCNTTKPHFPLT